MPQSFFAALLLGFVVVGCGDSKDDASGSGGTGGTGGASGDCRLFEARCNGACLREGDELDGCKVLSSNPTFDLAFGAGSLYYNDIAFVGRLDLESLERQDLVEGLESAYELAFSGDTLYFDTSTSEAALGGDPMDGTVRSLPAAGGTPTLLTRVPDSLYELAVSGSMLYFETGPVGHYELMELPIAGGTATNALLLRDIAAFAIDGTSRYYTRATDINLHKLRSTPLADPTQETVVADLGIVVDGLFADATHVYFTGFDELSDPVQGVLGRVPKTGGAVERLATGHVLYVIKLVETGSVYALEVDQSVGSRLVRFRLDGGLSETIATFSDQHDLPVVTDGPYFYVASNGILRIAR